ncbi:sigma-70 family RNA polymerase sigma factor [Putridiphycobacter roseus]|uniref:Sigma-70 family RNA polymerase sigma factor n=1 Tax=Putridiphycobacter roseus TaxID=2219161 RepID=A0A2W1N023_9FLAO|nr:RNA polymerase sigma factor [Putridiphycobacter roseus]PZE16890.1 sigma-70 family RNA polymerase sigma factor [Putridiphycobacter roseus]
MVDQALINLCKKNDRKAQEKLYEWCYVKLMPMCARYHRNEEDARHVLNISFVKICKNLDKLADNSPFEAWARRIVRNTIIDEFRKTKNYVKLIETKEFERELEVKSPLVENTVWSKLETDVLMGMLKKLPDVSRKVFNLYVIDGYTHKEIGNLLSISDGTSKWHLSNARKKLQIMVGALRDAENNRMWANG